MRTTAIDDRVFQALANPTRRAIFESLKRGEAAVKDLTARFDISQPAVSQHLGTLADAGLVTRRREGRCVYYRVEPRGLKALTEWVDPPRPERDDAEGGLDTQDEACLSSREDEASSPMTDIYRALADPTRRFILDELSKRERQTLFEVCGRLAMAHGISMSRQAVSQHLAVLEAVGLVRTERQGRTKLHWFDGTSLKAVLTRWPIPGGALES